MSCRCATRAIAGFTLIELVVAMAISGILLVAVLSTWTMLQASALNVRRQAEGQADQMRVLDYLRRDIRRAASVEIYDGATLVTGSNSGGELRLTVPNYYADLQEEDVANGTATPRAPVLVAGQVEYGALLTIRYFVLNGAIVRREEAITREISAPNGAFTATFRREPTGEIRATVTFQQTLRGGASRTVRREVELLCLPRTELQS